MKYYFTSWIRILLSNKIIPLLVIKQSDLESSKLLGLVEALKLLEKYIRVSTRLIVVITKVNSKYTIE